MNRRSHFRPAGRRADFGDLPPRIYDSYRAERDRLMRRFWVIALPVAVLFVWAICHFLP